MFKRKILTKEPDNKEKAYEYAVYLLSLSLRTSGELEKKLQQKGYTEETIHTVLKELKEARYVDDQRYAEVYLENLKKYKTFGYYGIKKKLMEKRLPQNIIERVLSEGLGEDEEIKIANRFLKKFNANSVYKTKKTLPGSKEDAKQVAKPRYHSTEDESYGARQKLAQKLRARGFNSSVISKAIF
ncbi:MAG: regulatory protein RecX [Candidatus Doudnabacteria bacterium]|jgi:SOS response regulatory protein OraA/RecX